MRIVPAVLTDRLEQLRAILKTAEGFTDFVQIDFMDGRFVPSNSVSPKDMHGIKTTLVCEAHLMVENPEQCLSDLRLFGFKRIIFHYEADCDPRSVIRGIRAHGIEVGMALNPETDIAGVEDFISVLDSVLFLSVRPGFYGSPFIPSVLEKIREFRQLHSSIIIGIDGGVGLDNIMRVKSVGVDYACVGSRIFLSEDPSASYRELGEKAGG